MTTSHATPYFVGDHLALDFLNSRVAPANAPAGESFDWLGNGAQLLDWLVDSGAVDVSVARQFRGKKDTVAGLDEVAREARDLRDWLADFLGRHAGRRLGRDVAADLAPLNKLLARDDTYRAIEAATSGASALDWCQRRRWTPERLLMPIAEAIGDLVCHCDFRLVRTCEGADCILMFYDRTKAHARRWCSMALCGNRAKAAAHRARHRLKEDRPPAR